MEKLEQRWHIVYSNKSMNNEKKTIKKKELIQLLYVTITVTLFYSI